MEQLKALANDPAKLEAKLKEDGAVTFEVFAEAGKKMQQALNLNKEPTDEEKQKYKQLLDPNNTGKITFENFQKFIKAGLEKLKQ